MCIRDRRYKLDERELRSRLMARRRVEAEQLKADQRRPFYTRYDETVRRPQLDLLQDRRRLELSPLARKRMPSFATWKRKVQRLVAAMHANWAKLADTVDGAATSVQRIPTLAMIPALSSARALSTAEVRPTGIRQLRDFNRENDGVPHSSKIGIDPKGGGLRASGAPRRSEQDVILEHGSSASPRIDLQGPIDGYYPKLMPGGFRYARRGEPPAFVERGPRISVKIASDDALRAALKLSLMRTDGPIVVRASPEVMERIYRIADTLGVGDRLIDGEGFAQAETQVEGATRPDPSPSSALTLPSNTGDRTRAPAERRGEIYALAEGESRRDGVAITKPKGPGTDATPLVRGKSGQER